MANQKDKEHGSNIRYIEGSRSSGVTAYNRAVYGERIKKYRLERGLTQPKLAAVLGVHRNYISNWESGVARPDLNRIPQLCEALGISVNRLFGQPDKPMTSDPVLAEIIRSYALMDDRSKAALSETCAALLRVQERELYEHCKRNFVKVFHGEQTAAAGTLNPLDDDRSGEYEYIRINNGSEIPDEIITVAGDSMEPTFYAGDDLLVRRTETLRDGEIGIIIINGEGYVKEYHTNGVRSHNEARYPFRYFEEGDDVRCFGRILGKVTDTMRPDAREYEVLGDLYAKERSE